MSVRARFGYIRLVDQRRRIGEAIQRVQHIRQFGKINRRQRDIAIIFSRGFLGADLFADQFRAGFVIYNPLVFINIRRHDPGRQIRPADLRIIGHGAEKGLVSPTHSRFGLLRGHCVIGVRFQRSIHFKLAHQTGVKADQLKLIQTGALLHRIQRADNLIQVQLVFFVRIRIRPATRPAHAMIRENQRVTLRRIIFNRPGYKICQSLAIGHVQFAQVIQFFRIQAVQVVILRDIKAFGRCPIAVAVEPAVIAVELRNNLDVVR